MNRIVDAIPYARFLGVEVERSDGALECILLFRHEIVGNPALPAVHGGVLGALLELTALLHLLDDSGGERVPKPITFSVDDESARRDLQAWAPHRQRARRRLARRPQPPGGRRERQVPSVLTHSLAAGGRLQSAR